MKQFFQFATLLFALFLCTDASAQRTSSGGGGGAGKVSFSDLHIFMEDADQWVLKALPSEGKDGPYVVATSKTDRSQLIVKMRNGRIEAFGHQFTGGVFVGLTPNATGCSPSGFCATNQIKHCFTLPGGQCVCVCGAWITNYPSGDN